MKTQAQAENPFPGMNPYLEGGLWSDFHTTFMVTLQEKLVDVLPDKYNVSIQHYFAEDNDFGTKIKAYIPDVAVAKDIVAEPSESYSHSSKIEEATLVVPAFEQRVEVKIFEIEIVSKTDGKLITCIELLSPANKKGEGFKKYQQKRKNLLTSQVNLVEIDLLRGGKRVFVQQPAVEADYLIAITKGGENKTRLWTKKLPDRLPVIPIPLLKEDADLGFDLQQALNERFTKSKYFRRISNYLAHCWASE